MHGDDIDRRGVVLGLLQGAMALVLFASTTATLGQRVTQPIYRPPPGRPNLRLRPGLLDPSGVNYGSAPGSFTVVSITAPDNAMRLRDDAGNVADVYVSERMFDVETLKPGDVVVVDFFVPGDNDDRLEAASIEVLTPLSR